MTWLHKTNSYIVHVKCDDLYADIAGDVEKRFDKSNYEVELLLLMGKNQKKLLD